jgi:hypothetical protein
MSSIAELQPPKKEQILSLYTGGISDVKDLAVITNSRPTYVASVLQRADLQPSGGYFDLYTSTSQPMNVYSKFFAGALGFKDVETARRSVEHIDRLYRQFGLAADRAGQHHALLMALTMFDRARWTNKTAEADIFRQWLLQQLQESGIRGQESGARNQGSGKKEQDPVKKSVKQRKAKVG